MEIENEHTLVVHAPKDSNTFKNSQHGTAKQTHKFSFSKVKIILTFIKLQWTSFMHLNPLIGEILKHKFNFCLSDF